MTPRCEHRWMRIAITGAHGVGKSTLAARLAGEFGIPELPTPGRTLAARGLPINRSATVTSQTAAWLFQYRLEREQVAWVASRSLIDVWAYTVQTSVRKDLDLVEQALLEELAKATPLALFEAYDELIYVPPRIPLIADAVRSDESSFQREIDEAIRKALAAWRVPHTTVDVTDEMIVENLLERLRERLASASRRALTD
jgi:nicotinamide riboside kinase